MTTQTINFEDSTDIIIPISDVIGTNIKRKFVVTSVPTGLDTKQMKVQGFVKHYTVENIDILSVITETEVPFTSIKDYYYELTANDNVKVNEDGSFNPNSTIGEYTWIRLIIKNGVMTSDDIVVKSILRQDSLGLIKPR